MSKHINKRVNESAVPVCPLPPPPEQLGDHRSLLRVTKMRTLRMAMRRSLREVIARMVSWARFSNGRTASSHQHHAGPLGLACRREKVYTVRLISVYYETFAAHTSLERVCWFPTWSAAPHKGSQKDYWGR